MTTEERQALEFAKVLRSATHPEVIQALRVRATKGHDPLARRAALLALEGRPVEVWWDPVTRAFQKDPDPGVRKQAADVLARILANPEYADVHADVRTLLVLGLRNVP